MRSNTSRHIWGGLWGGFLGIIIAGLFHRFLLPLGCFVGVLGGFYYQEIWQIFLGSLKEEWKRLTVLWGTIQTGWGVTQTVWSATTEWLTQEITIPRFKDLLIIRLFWAILRLPVYPFVWLKHHPINRMHTLRALAILVYLAINGVLLSPIFLHTNIEMTYSPESWMSVAWAMLCVCSLTISVTVPAVTFETGEKALRARRRRYLVFGRRGAAYFFLNDLVAMFRIEGMAVVMMALVVIYWVIAGSIFLSVLFLPIAAFVYALRGILALATSKQHLLCLGTTLVVTIASAWVFRDLLQGTSLWLVALATGAVSGMTSEVVRQVVITWVDESWFSRIAQGGIAPILQGCWKGIADIWGQVEDSLRGGVFVPTA